MVTRSSRRSTAEVVSALVPGVLSVAAAIALPFAAAAEPEGDIPFISPADPVWWIAVAFVVMQALALVWVKSAPRLVLVAITAIPVLHALVIPGITFSLTTLAVSFGVFWVVFLEQAKPRAVLPLVALVVAGAQILNNVRSGAPFDLVTTAAAVMQGLVIVGVALVIGLYFAARRQAQRSRDNELLALERERDALVQAAVSRERIAMSRELHDIAAHHMSGIALLASAIYRQVDIDPEAAKIAAQQVRSQSTTVLEDLRRVIGLLRDDTESSRLVETLAAVGELVELRRAAGTEVTFELLTTEHELGAGIGPLGQLVAYRMVQESLANAATHAPGANCVVKIDDRDPARVTVLVENDGAHAPDLGPGSGFGLVGMRERADLVDGELHYGDTGNGGWAVHLTLKRDAIIKDLTEAVE